MKITDEHREIANQFEDELIRLTLHERNGGSVTITKELIAKALAQRDQVMIEKICDTILNLGVTVQNQEATLTGNEIDNPYRHLVKAIRQLGEDK